MSKKLRFDAEFEQQGFPEKKRTEDLYAFDHDDACQEADTRLAELIEHSVFSKDAYVAAIRGGM